MLQPRLRTSLRVLERTFAPSRLTSQQPRAQSQFLSPRIPTISSTSPSSVLQQSLLSFTQVRHASHNTQGRANNGSRDSAGKRLGAKKSGDQYVIPGNIIFRQRGSKWFPGENCAMGRDHTIYATETGYVKYYLDPERHPKRKYIGVAFERTDSLPTPRNAPTKRRLGMIAHPRPVEPAARPIDADLVTVGDATNPRAVPAELRKELPAVKTNLTLRPGYMYREANWEIGRAAEKAGIQVREWRRNDRWLAWRRKMEKIKRVAQMKSLKNAKKGSGKKKAKKAA